MSKHVKGKISLYIDAMLSGSELEAFEAHIKTCGDCASALNVQKDAVKAVKKARNEDPLPVNFYAKLNEKLDAVDASKKKPVIDLGIFIRTSAAAFAVVLVGLFVYNLKEQTNNFSSVTSAGESQMPAAEKKSGKAGPLAAAQKPAVPPANAREIKADKIAEDNKTALSLIDAAPAKKSALRAPQEPVAVVESRAKAAAPLKMEAEKADMYEVAAGAAVDGLKAEAAPAEAKAQGFVFRDAAAWNAFAESNGIREKEPVDFTRQMIVTVFIGTRPTAGFWVEIKDTVYSAEKVTVYYKEHSPEPGSMNAQVITHPHAEKVIKRSDLVVEFVELR